MSQRILVVDDDADLRQTLLSGLAPIGEILEASNGQDALRKVKSQKPKLMSLDVSMPEMSGIDVLQAARSLAPRMVVVMLTGECDLAVAKRTLELGARTYITKPFNIDIVFGEIQRLLEEMTEHGGSAPYRPWRVAI